MWLTDRRIDFTVANTAFNYVARQVKKETVKYHVQYSIMTKRLYATAAIIPHAHYSLDCACISRKTLSYAAAEDEERVWKESHASPNLLSGTPEPSHI